MEEIIPIVLFAYARPDHLKRILDCLKENQVPLIYAFCDGAKSSNDDEWVEKTRKLLHQVDWCEIQITEREKNLGLGQSILTGVTEILKNHDKIIVFEDDLICVPGTYQYFCAALKYYQNNPKVMSITGWTHPIFKPESITNSPYFDGRTECISWGTWSRAWQGMEKDAMTLLHECKKKGIDIYRYGLDLPEMARMEKTKNIWAVRFTYLHFLNQGLCLRPPFSMIEHEGYDINATNAPVKPAFYNEILSFPIIPEKWPDAIENPECPILWRDFFGNYPYSKNYILNYILEHKYLWRGVKYFLLSLNKKFFDYFHKDVRDSIIIPDESNFLSYDESKKE